jgi:SAM-dependent methyltransferase
MNDSQAYYQTEKKCPLCRQDSAFLFLRNFSSADGKFSLYECKSCGGQFWLPFKNPGAEWYVNGDKYNVKDGSQPRVLHAYHKNFFDLHPQLAQGVKILDLGCGTGEFLAALKSKGAEVYGVDLDREAVGIARNHFGLENIANMPISSFLADKTVQALDFITAFETFEHIDDPAQLLAEAMIRLKAGGRLIISAPSRERPFANAAGWDFPFHHLSRWSEDSVRYLWRSFGFKNISIIYLNKFQQLYELFLEVLARKLKFNRAAGLKKISREEKSTVGEKKSEAKKFIIKIIYLTGRWIGVVLLPYLMAAAFFPIVLLFYPRAGLMYIEAVKE